MDNFKILIDTDELYKKIKHTANEINKHYGKNELLNIICILKGGAMYALELVKYLKMPIKLEFVRLSSYGNSTETSGKVSAVMLQLPDYKNQNVLIVDDIMDSGLTIKFLKNYINDNCRAKDIKIATMLEKKCARKEEICADFYSAEVDDKFLIGFGLDYKGLYCNLNYIAYVE